MVYRSFRVVVLSRNARQHLLALLGYPFHCRGLAGVVGVGLDCPDCFKRVVQIAACPQLCCPF